MKTRRMRHGALATLVATAVIALTGCNAVIPAPEEPSVKAVDFGTKTEGTPGNATLALGQPAWLTKSDTQGTPSAAVSILEVIEGDPAIYDEWGSSGEQFAGSVPYYVIVQTTRQTDDNAEYAVYPLSETGQTTEFVVNLLGSSSLTAGTTDCPLTLPAYDETTRTEITCVIGVAKNGEKIVGGVYNGGGYSGFQLFGSDPEYGTAPVTWLVAETAGPIRYDATAIDMGTPGAATAPGTRVARGTTAWLPLPDDTTQLVGTSILDVIPAEADYFDRYPNASDFAGYTAEFIVVQLQYPDDESARLRTLPPMYPVLSDGNYSEWLRASSALSISQAPGLKECDLVLPTYDPATRTFVGCIAAITQSDARVSHVEYNGESYGAFLVQDKLGYHSNPVIFG